MKELHDIIENPPALVWFLLILLVCSVIAISIRDTLKPVISSFINAMAAQVQQNPLVFLLAIFLGISATADAIVDVWAPLMPDDEAKMGWWQLFAYLCKSIKPFAATIAALLINPPAIKSPSNIGKPGSGVSAPPFSVAQPTEPSKPAV